MVMGLYDLGGSWEGCKVEGLDGEDRRSGEYPHVYWYYTSSSPMGPLPKILVLKLKMCSFVLYTLSNFDECIS